MKMNKKLWIAAFLCLPTGAGALEVFFAYDCSFFYEYAQGIGGISTLFYPDYIGNGEFRIPLETRVVFVKNLQFVENGGQIDLSINCGTSFYLKENTIPSLQLSPGISIYTDLYPLLKGISYFYISVYPVYEYPLINFRNAPSLKWTTAGDMGFIVDIGSTPLFISGYIRVIFTLLGETEGKVDSFPDMGFLIGLHFR